MPSTGALSRFSTYCGLAIDRNNAMLSTAVLATVTSLVLTNINFVTTNPLVLGYASYSGIIIDGPNTEVVTFSGYTTGTLTCSSLAHNHPAFTYIVFQLTASIGPT